MKLLIITYVLMAFSASANQVSGTPSGTGAGSGLGAARGAYTVPGPEPSFSNQGINAWANPADPESPLNTILAPEQLNTAPNPAPDLNYSGVYEDGSTLVPLQSDQIRPKVEERQAEEARPGSPMGEDTPTLDSLPTQPQQRMQQNPYDMGTDIEGRPLGPGVK